MQRPFSRKILIAGGILLSGIVFAVVLVRMNTRSTATPAASTIIPTASSDQPTDWRSIPFVNVRTNQPMTLADFAGKTVVVEAVSIWCANCVVQQKESAKALARFDKDAPIYISLDLDIAHPDDDAQAVANHEEYKQFPWIFAISNKTFTRALINQFGYNVLNAPITPIFVVSPDGTASDLYTGNRSADEMFGLMHPGLKT